MPYPDRKVKARMSKPEYYGYATRSDGSHVPLTAKQAEAIWDAVQRQNAKRAEMTPTTIDALQHALMAVNRLEDLGWQKAIHCPKDQSEFAVVRPGYTGIYRAFYTGEWPSGELYCCDEMTSPQGHYWKAISSLTKDERDVLNECTQNEIDFIERQFQIFEQIDALDEKE